MKRLFGGLLSGLNIMASLWIMAVIALISADVIGRSGFNHPLPGVPELVRFSIVTMFWLQMAHVLRVGGHLRTTLGLDALPTIGRRIVLMLNAAIGVVMFGLVAWLGSIEMLKTWEIGAFEGEHPMRIPIWPVWAAVAGGAALTAVQYFIHAVSGGQGEASKSPPDPE